MGEIKGSRLSERLKAYRVAQNKTQEQMSEYFGVSKHSYYLWERKGKKPAVGHLVLIADLLNLSFEEALRMTDME